MAKKETVIKKNQTADIPTRNGNRYSYQYVDIAQIHEYLEQNNMSYYQYIKRIEGDDYIMTVRIIDGEEKPALQGARIVDSTLFGNDNPAQKQGSALTYARRYSLLMAFGLATEDDDANSLNKNEIAKKYKSKRWQNNDANSSIENGVQKQEITTKEQAENYKLSFGKYKGIPLKDLVYKDPGYCDWLYGYEKADPVVKKALDIILKEAISKGNMLEEGPSIGDADSIY